MYLYLIFGILTILAFLDVFCVKTARSRPIYQTLFISICLFLFLLSALRYDRGTDWSAYLNYFRLSSDWNFQGWMEWGFTMLNKLVNLISDNYSVMVFVVTLLVYLIKPKVIFDLAPYPFVTLWIWYGMSIADIFPVRQTIATAFVLYSFVFVVKRKFIPFFIWVFLASLFHLSSLIFLVTYFLYNRYLSRFWCVTLFVAGFVVAFVAKDIVSNFLAAIPSQIIQERINDYLEWGSDTTFGSAYSTTEVLVRGFVNRSMIMVMIFAILNDFRKTDPVFNGWVNLFVFSGICFAMLSSVNVALGRLVVYFDISQIFVFSYLFCKKMSVPNKLIVFGVITVYLLYRFMGVVNNYYDLYVPYKSIFDL